MRRLRLFAVFLLLAACSSPASRIRKNQAAYDAWPPEVQAAVKAGRADVGFTPEQVRVALGRADRVYTRKSQGLEQEVWAYEGVGGRTSLGFGYGMAGGGSSYGLGVGVGGPDYRDSDRVRVVFESGRVVSIERREK